MSSGKRECNLICTDLEAEYGDCPCNGCSSVIGTRRAVPETSLVDVWTTLDTQIPCSLHYIQGAFNVGVNVAVRRMIGIRNSNQRSQMKNRVATLRIAVLTPLGSRISPAKISRFFFTSSGAWSSHPQELKELYIAKARTSYPDLISSSTK